MDCSAADLEAAPADFESVFKLKVFSYKIWQYLEAAGAEKGLKSVTFSVGTPLIPTVLPIVEPVYDR